MARLEAALDFWERKYPQGDSEDVAEESEVKQRELTEMVNRSSAVCHELRVYTPSAISACYPVIYQEYDSSVPVLICPHPDFPMQIPIKCMT